MNSLRFIPAVTRRARFIRGLAPLLLAAAVSDVCAVEVIIIGPADAPVSFVLANSDASNTLRLSGGLGQAATGTVTTVSGAPAVLAYAIVQGGGFTVSDEAVPSVFGGNASSTANAYGQGAAEVVARAEAVGGRGGPIQPGWLDGGLATAQAYGQSDTGNVTVSASATGGNNRDVALNNAVSGSTRGQLALSQRAVAVQEERYWEPDAPFAGHASSVLDLTDSAAGALSADVSAVGANGFTYVPGGYAESRLTLTSTRTGANVAGTVTATGGEGGYFSAGHYAIASATLAGTADVTGTATATGGRGGADGGAGLGGPGTALASLALTAGGLADGTVTARGGELSFIGTYYYNDATATLTLVGAGARGSALAIGGNASSDVAARTTGAQAVDVTSTAQLADAGRYVGGIATANTDVRIAPGGGQGAVRAAAYADGGSSTGIAVANVRVASAGEIVAVARAKGGFPSVCCYASSGDAYTSVDAVTSGSHGVTATASSLANIGSRDGSQSYSGYGTAYAYGRSGSGIVNVAADARGGEVYGVTAATARAVTTALGGVSRARALATGVEVAAAAAADAIGRQGAATSFSSAASGTVARSATAYSASVFSQADWTLPVAGGDYVAATAMAASGELLGAGMHAASNSYTAAEQPWPSPEVIMPESSARFQFATAADQHLQVAFIEGAGSGFDVLELTIFNHGLQLFSRTFLGGAEADLFFNGYVLDLGLLGAGAQDLVIRSAYTFTVPGSYAFNYLVGSSVTAVPEPSTWLLLLLGTGGVVFLARRRTEKRSCTPRF